jgi:tetratricopeptide (TPR) repeat protein
LAAIVVTHNYWRPSGERQPLLTQENQMQSFDYPKLWVLICILVSSLVPLPVEAQHSRRLSQSSQSERSANDLLKTGTEYLSARRYDKAIESLKQALELNPNLAPAYLNLGSAYLQLGSYSDAVESIKKAIAINPKDAESRFELGNAYVAMRRPVEAAESFKEAVRLNPGFANAQMGLGNVYLNVGQLEQAVSAYQETIRLNPKLVGAHHNLGIAYVRLGRTDVALESLKTAVQLNPNDARALSIIGEIYHRTGKYTEEIEVFEQLSRMTPLQAGTLQTRSYAHLYLAHGEAAASDAQAALKMKGWRDKSSAYLALVEYFGYRQAKRDEEAQKILDEAISQLEPNTWPYPILRYLKREITAVDLLKASMNNDETTEIRAYLGMDLSLSGKKQEALDQLKWVKEYGNRNFVEYPMAVTEIARLEGGSQK